MENTVISRVILTTTVGIVFGSSISSAETTVVYRPTHFDEANTTLEGGRHVWDGWLPSVFYSRAFQLDEKYRVGGWGDTYETFIKFDLVGLPRYVSKAQLWLRARPQSGSSTPVSMNINLPTVDWTKEARLPVAPNSWDRMQTSGGTFYASNLPAPTPGNGYLIDITGAYNAWQAGSNPNYGIRLDPVATDNRFNEFSTVRSATRNDRPALILTFETGTAPIFSLPLTGGIYWKITTEAGGYDCRGGEPDPFHQKQNFFSLDFSWRNLDSSGTQRYSAPPSASVVSNKAKEIPVRAAADGKVVTATSNSSNGNYVVIDHDLGNSSTYDGDINTGYSSRYLHMKSPLEVRKGDTVMRGQILGYMGNTGLSDGTHLHFGIRYRNDGSSTVGLLRRVILGRVLLKGYQTGCPAELGAGYYYSDNTR
jgi:hypothetical protein